MNHLLWINQHASPIGGCERYILQTNQLLKQWGFRTTLLYEVDGAHDPAWVKHFDGVFPLVHPQRQLEEIQPDGIYIHRLTDDRTLTEVRKTGIPSIRFFHDHQLFCLREHKYTTLGNQTCTRPVGWRCYPCLGFLYKSPSWPGINWRTLGSLKRRQNLNRNLQAYVVGSAYMKQHVAAHGFDADKIQVLPMFTDPPAPRSEKREEDLLLFVGQLNRGKGLDLVLKALAQIASPPRLLVVGSGNQETEYRTLCEYLGIGSRVTFAGKASADALALHYQRATCVVFPSRSPETFGLVGIESMSYGCPVIAADVGGVREWLLDGQTGLLFPSNDINALADRIRRMFFDREYAEKLGEQGLLKVKSDFQPDIHRQKLLALFQSVVG